MSDIYYYFSYSPEKPILALQKQVAENLENAPLLITWYMSRVAWLLRLQRARQHPCCVSEHQACGVEDLSRNGAVGLENALLVVLSVRHPSNPEQLSLSRFLSGMLRL